MGRNRLLSIVQVIIRCHYLTCLEFLIILIIKHIHFDSEIVLSNDLSSFDSVRQLLLAIDPSLKHIPLDSGKAVRARHVRYLRLIAFEVVAAALAGPAGSHQPDLLDGLCARGHFLYLLIIVELLVHPIAPLLSNRVAHHRTGDGIRLRL